MRGARSPWVVGTNQSMDGVYAPVYVCKCESINTPLLAPSLSVSSFSLCQPHWKCSVVIDNTQVPPQQAPSPNLL